MFVNVIQRTPREAFHRPGVRRNLMSRGREGHIVDRLTLGEVNNATSSTVSDLEAFSPKPTLGSFAALPFQATALPIE